MSAAWRRFGYVLAAGSAYYWMRRRDRATRNFAAKQQAIYGAVVEHSDDAIVSVRLDGRVVAWNSGAHRLFGWSRAEAMATPALGKTDPEILTRLAAGERGIQYETQAVRKDGTTVDVWATVSPVFGPDGTLTGAATISRDLTAVKAAEQRAENAQRMASLGQLAGGVAHDFNNLLGIILSFIDFAAEDADDPDRVRTDLGKARRAAERATDLTRQLLTFTRQDTVRARPLDLNDSLAEARDLLAVTLGARVTLIVTGAPRPLTIVADPGHIQQVLINLALNARDAMPAGGTLTITAALAGRHAQITVTDTGTGMPPDVAARIFDPFYTTKPAGSGTGLGLATVYGIVTTAAGSIDVTSTPGEGTTFEILFPYVEAAPETHLPADPQPPQGHGETILITDDEPALGETAARILTAGGYHVTTATSGPQALNLAAATPPDLLLTDVTMPEMSGKDLAEALNIPVLYMSGYTNGLLDAATQLNVLEKPFTPQALLTAVRTALDTPAAK